MKVNLSVNGIKELSNTFKGIENRFKKMRDPFIEKSLMYIQERATEYIQATTGNSDWYTLTYKLEQSWIINLAEKSLMNYCEYSAMVEYGTGIIGAGTHPDSSEYQYDVNGHGEAGWFFFDDEEVLHWTQGMEAHAFLFNAVNDYLYGGGFQMIIKETLDEVFGGVK